MKDGHVPSFSYVKVNYLKYMNYNVSHYSI